MSQNPGKYILPGGTLNLNETPEQGAAREFEEETGIALSADRVVKTKKWYDPRVRATYYGVYFECTPDELIGYIRVSGENLTGAKLVEEKIKQEVITKYSQVHDESVGSAKAPRDNELDTTEMWDVTGRWGEIQGWTEWQSWYRVILEYLKDKI
ncbi:NUDIX hydrolase [Streptomyces buecherae]|uniref:NUDIX hydrolase n=2 Tax=Streptomyces buecherae TaxID=2763006 RepID=A0A7H8NK40_9ACTN|nr:NUDIX hydrolase [Streptomyces buecherae]